MSTANMEVFQGGTFVFEVIGGRFTIYTALVARKSKVLRDMMEIGMKESQDGVAPLPDTDVTTFGRFAEFLNSGDYNPAEAVQPSLPSSPTSRRDSVEQAVMREVPPHEVPDCTVEVDWDEPAPEVESVGSDWGLPLKKNKGKKVTPAKSGKKYGTYRVAEDLFPETPPAPRPTLISPTVDVVVDRPFSTSSMFVPNGDWKLDYLPLFLSHAQMYAFAEKYDVRDLQRLAVRRLEEALQQFRFASPCPTDFAVLLRYVYDHTPEREGQTDVMRTVVGNFVARNIKSLIGIESFRTLIEDGGSLSFDILSKTVCCL